MNTTAGGGGRLQSRRRRATEQEEDSRAGGGEQQRRRATEEDGTCGPAEFGPDVVPLVARDLHDVLHLRCEGYRGLG